MYDHYISVSILRSLFWNGCYVSLGIYTCIVLYTSGGRYVEDAAGVWSRGGGVTQTPLTCCSSCLFCMQCGCVHFLSEGRQK